MSDMSIRLNAKGMTAVARQFRAAGVDMQRLKGAYKKMAGVVKSNAKTTVPVRSGTLKRSIRSSATQKAGVVRAGSGKVPYAGVINYGWPRHNIKSTHFLERGLEMSEGEVVALYAQAIDDALDSIN